MSRRVQRVPVYLKPVGTETLPLADIRVILRAADPLVMTGGRSLLTKILRGSRAQDVLSHGLDQNPSYALYKQMSEEQVLGRIDWMIANGYLRVVYDGRLPLLAYTPTGWAIERETYADELIAGIDALLAGQQTLDMEHLKDRHRDLIVLVLSKIAESGNRNYLPVLEAWERIAYKKTKKAIRVVKSVLSEYIASENGSVRKTTQAVEPQASVGCYLEECLAGKASPSL